MSCVRMSQESDGEFNVSSLRLALSLGENHTRNLLVNN